MSMFLKLKIGTRLSGAFAVLLLLLVAVSATAYVALAGVFGDLKRINSDVVPSLRAVAELDAASTRMRRYNLAHVLADTAESKQKTEATIRSESEKIAAVLAKYRRELATDEMDRSNIEQVARLWDAYAREWETVRPVSVAALTDPARAAEARRLVTGPLSLSFQQVTKAMTVLGEYNAEVARAMAASAEATYQRARMTLIGGAVASLLLALGLAWAITRSITRPLDVAVHAARTISHGDLTARLDGNSRDEIGALLDAMRSMQQNLRSLVGDIRSTVESVATASDQIAQGNQDLSERTEQQASSLQQTAASMEELTSTVRQNADTSRHANEIANGASATAGQGGEVMARVVATMRDIAEASQKIAEIIGVIDGIAFQTNILALNAAVEAARAGEQGRGFAVVAGEVRSLAQRSAEAAREIKALIGSSVERVEAGSTLVEDAGRTMNDIVASVRQVATLLDEIAAASREQSAGIDQINAAVTQLDQVTQQNAALVEESAAAAASLKDQARGLTQTVATFRTEAVSAPAALSSERAGAGRAAAGRTIERALATATTASRALPAPAALATAATGSPAANGWTEL